jgi:hypothetical protein
MIRKAAIVPPYFVLRAGCGLVLLKLATSWLTPGGFSLFAQLGLFAALENFLCGGAMQNGIVRGVASAEGDHAAISGIHAAAARLLAAACAVVAIGASVGAPQISVILAGNDAHSRSVITITLLCLLGAPGQLWCAMLTGRGGVVPSLIAQAAGLVFGTAAAALALSHGDAAGAALGLASGGVVTTILAAGALRPWRFGRAPIRPADTAMLMRFAIIIGGSFALTSAALFALRFAYRESQGATALGFWLVANRISDMSTQLVGLMMAQIVLPELARARGAEARRAVLLRGAGFGAAVTVLALLAFAAGARQLVSTFLSPAYIAAIPAIAIYLSGDVLRALVSLAQQVNLADGRLRRYMAFELGGPAILAIVAVGLLARGVIWAPQIGYLVANGLLAGLVLIGLLRTKAAYPLARTRAETV